MKFPSKKLLVGALLAGLALSPMGVRLAAQAVDEAAYKRISDKLICQCGCNYGLSWCPHLQCPSAPIIRQAIREKLSAGQSEEHVLQAMVAQFGPAVLAAPPAKGFNWSAWLMPFVALLVGLWVVQRVARRWRARPAPGGAADAALLDPALRDRVAREMKRLEE